MLKLDSSKGFAILGLGISGIATLDFLIEQGIEKIFVSDANDYDKVSPCAFQVLEANKNILDCEFGNPHSEKCLEYDYLIVSPGMSPKAEILIEAKQRGLKVITELDLASDQCKRNGSSKAKNYIGITGTNGKSTTTAWVGHILQIPACGNIGIPFIQAISNEPENEWYACEMSSFQLEHSQYLHPKIAAITNITPDHINWHGSWENYLSSKIKITQHQTSDDWLLIPNSTPLKELQTKAQICWVEATGQASTNFQNAIWVNEKKHVLLRLNGVDQVICETAEIPLPGKHNLENAMFAAAISLLTGAPLENVKARLLSFNGLEHRIEFVRELEGKKFYNDSKATNPESSMVALEAFEEPIVWLAGGRDKMTDLKDLVAVVKRKVATAILYGEASERFREALIENSFKGDIHKVTDLKEAVKLSLSEESNLVLLSPACASFDQFSNFEERGRTFKKLVESA